MQLVAAGICGGDWERIEETWTMQRYELIQDYWATQAPPLNITMAAYAGFQPKVDASRRLAEDAVRGFDPQMAEQVATSMPGGVQVSPEGFMFGPPVLPKE